MNCHVIYFPEVTIPVHCDSHWGRQLIIITVNVILSPGVGDEDAHTIVANVSYSSILRIELLEREESGYGYSVDPSLFEWKSRMEGGGHTFAARGWAQVALCGVFIFIRPPRRCRRTIARALALELG